jgi:hypothetical protein
MAVHAEAFATSPQAEAGLSSSGSFANRAQYDIWVSLAVENARLAARGIIDGESVRDLRVPESGPIMVGGIVSLAFPTTITCI